MTTRINHRIIGTVSSFLLMFVACFMSSCAQDDGNYDYLPDEEVSKIVLERDTVRSKNGYVLQNIDPGGEYEMNLRVEYAYPERLQYTWFYLKSNYGNYQQVVEGNALVYPKRQIIYREKDLKWTCDLEPGTYKIYCEAKDTVNGMMAYYFASPYTVVSQPGNVSGLFLLT